MRQERGVPGTWAAAVAIPLALSVLLPGPAAGQEVVDLRTLDLPRWTLEEELRLGSVNGEYDAFVTPRLEVDAQGRLYVIDARLPAVRVFDADGTYIRQIGRKGGGPGEYTIPVGLGFLGDTVWIADWARRHLAFFDGNGQLLEDFGLEPVGASMEPPMPIQVLGPDDFVVVVPPTLGSSFRGYGVGRVAFPQSFVRRNRSGTRMDTLFTYTRDSGYIITQADAEGMNVVPSPQIRRLPQLGYDGERNEIIEVAPSAETRADVGEFRVTIRHPDGTVVAERRFRYRPVVLPESVKDSLRDELRSRFRPGPGSRKHAEVALEYFELPDFLIPATGVAYGADGTRWIDRDVLLVGAPPRHYLVTDSTLNPLATVELPPAAVGLTGSRDRNHLWAIVKDDLDVRYLVRYRIIRPETSE
ncbi:MAG TPA: 6-bladed beta-propeller [Longimicrobiales bacterium]